MTEGKQKRKLNNQEAIKANVIKNGEVRNPNGRPVGKNARTIVKEFMNKEIQTLEGTKVSRFQYLLWSMYETNFIIMKQLKFRQEDFKTAQKEHFRLLENPIREGEDKDEGKYKAYCRLLKSAHEEVRKTSASLESLTLRVQEAQSKLSESLQKSSGQYLTKMELETVSTQPLHVHADKEDLAEALGEIDEEC